MRKQIEEQSGLFFDPSAFRKTKDREVFTMNVTIPAIILYGLQIASYHHDIMHIHAHMVIDI